MLKIALDICGHGVHVMGINTGTTAMENLQKIAQQFGYNIRQVPKGYFISERDREDPRRVHDSLMLIGHDGEITVYEHDAQAFLAAKVIGQQIKARGVKS